MIKAFQMFGVCCILLFTYCNKNEEKFQIQWVASFIRNYNLVYATTAGPDMHLIVRFDNQTDSTYYLTEEKGAFSVIYANDTIHIKKIRTANAYVIAPHTEDTIAVTKVYFSLKKEEYARIRQILDKGNLYYFYNDKPASKSNFIHIPKSETYKFYEEHQLDLFH